MPDDRVVATTDSRMRTLTCREAVELITAYLEAALDEHERALVADHLAACANCTRYLEQMRQTVIWVSHQSGNGVSPAVKTELLDRFRRWRSSEPQ